MTDALTRTAVPGADEEPPVPPSDTGDAPAAKAKGGRGKSVVIALLVVVVLALAAGGGYLLYQSNSDSSSASSGPNAAIDVDTRQPAAEPGSVQEVAAQVLPSVVSIFVRSGNTAGSGSGVVLSDDGLILTNDHVISLGSAREPDRVQVSFSDGAIVDAEVLGGDPVSDLAVIKVDRTDVQPITVGTSSNLAVGQEVIAIGSPLGLEGTVTTGIISALHRPVAAGGGTADSVFDAIQTDAAINHGNSGGALVNTNGALIGINTAIATADSGGGSIGLGFAIPIDQAKRVADLLANGEPVTHASLGVILDNSATMEQPGAQIREVAAGGSAAQAGIPARALITKVDDRPIRSGDALIAAIRSFAPGDTVRITYLDGGTERTTDVVLGGR